MFVTTVRNNLDLGDVDPASHNLDSLVLGVIIVFFTFWPVLNNVSSRSRFRTNPESNQVRAYFLFCIVLTFSGSQPFKEMSDWFECRHCSLTRRICLLFALTSLTLSYLYTLAIPKCR